MIYGISCTSRASMLGRSESSSHITTLDPRTRRSWRRGENESASIRMAEAVPSSLESLDHDSWARERSGEGRCRKVLQALRQQ